MAQDKRWFMHCFPCAVQQKGVKLFMGIIRNKKSNPKWEYVKWLYFFLLAFAGTLVIWYFAMSQQVLEWLTSGINTPVAF